MLNIIDALRRNGRLSDNVHGTKKKIALANDTWKRVMFPSERRWATATVGRHIVHTKYSIPSEEGEVTTR